MNIHSASEGVGGHGTSREMNVIEAHEVRSGKWHQRHGGSRAGVTVTGRGEQLRGKIAFLFAFTLGKPRLSLQTD